MLPQREQQNRLLDEMMCPLTAQILPQSIEERYELFLQRNTLTQEKKEFILSKTRFLNYRLLRAYIQANKKVIPSYILCYSTLNKGKSSGRVEYSHQGFHSLNKDEVKLLELDSFNALCHTNYKNVKELLLSPISFEEEVALRQKLTQNAYNLSTIAVLDSVDTEAKFDILLESKVYEDVKETILIKGKE